ncbi:MAG: ComEA family DNA-binding protein [Bacilli bacterium]|jgi:competence protein ComEA|nr:ComEA family DNA-binding protein [Bacilli bacterium]MDY0064106.1 ComEA family DNA-binding protein [Bacilli bacterium]
MKKKYIVYIIGGLILIIGLIWTNFDHNETPEPIPPSENISSYRIWVQIVGEINDPGIYEMDENSRIYELVQLAGGFTNRADAAKVNLVTVLNDGQVVVIPSHQEAGLSKININTASLEQLMELSGIGEVKAQNIIQYRQIHPFYTIDDLLSVSGITLTIFNNIKDKICV